MERIQLPHCQATTLLLLEMPSGAGRAEKLLTSHCNVRAGDKHSCESRGSQKNLHWLNGGYSTRSCVVFVLHHRWKEDSKAILPCGCACGRKETPREQRRDVPVHQSVEVSDLLFGTFRDWTGSADRMSSEFRESNKRNHICQGLFFFPKGCSESIHWR